MSPDVPRDHDDAFTPLLRGLRWRWPLVLLVLIPVVAGAAAWAYQQPRTYSADSVVALAPEREVGADVVRLLVPKYAVYVSSRGVLTDVAERTGVPADQLERAVAVSAPTDTSNVRITVRLGDPGLAVETADALADRAVKLAGRDDLLAAQVVSRAQPDDQPSGTDPLIVTLAAGLVALVAGLALAALVERSSRRVRTAADLTAVTRAPVLTRLHGGRRPSGEVPAGLDDRFLGDQVRALRARVLGAVRTERGRGAVVVVCSPGRGQGSTWVSALLAAASARGGTPTLVVDGELRSPGLAATLSIPASRALGDALGGTPLDHVLVHVAPNLTALPSAPDASALDLVPAGAAPLLGKARAESRLVLVDAPALLEGDTSATFAAAADAAVLVVPAGCRAREVEAAAALLHDVPVPLLGTVLVSSRIPAPAPVADDWAFVGSGVRR